MLPDRYRNFEDLKAAERELVDYRVVAVDRGSAVTIIAPHGGHIEPPTSTIAAAVAADDFNFYAFEGLRVGRPHHELHITSHNFDEPRCCGLVEASDVVVAIHGRLDRDEPYCVYVGGLDHDLRDLAAQELHTAGFDARIENHMFPAFGRENICNRGRHHKGTQLELPRGLRDDLSNNPTKMKAFVEALRRAIVATQ